jgi:enoyl-CoA hydratase/carnithine racemase
VSSGAPSVRGLGWSEPGDGIGLVTLSRPPVNALNWELKRGLARLLSDVGESDRIRCLIVASALPKTFCAGSDLHELAAHHAQTGAATERTRFEFALWEQLSALPQPSIAAIEGHALGSGLELAVACDFRVASEDAMLGLPEIKIGGAPGIQTLARLPFLVGLGTARRMLLLGESLPAADAHLAGLVDEVTPQGDALQRAVRLARRLCDLPTSSTRFLKAALTSATSAATDSVERTVLTGVGHLFQAPEMREGIRAFLEKRAPDFHSAVDAARGPAPR